MKILIVGSGGREHALTWRLKQSPRVTQLIAAPGNPGIAQLAECVPVAADNIEGLVDLARIERPNLVIVGQAFAGPMLDHLEEDPGRFDLSSLMMISSSGVMWSRENKDGVARGGAFFNPPASLRSASRYFLTSDFRSHNLGIRPIRRIE